MKWLYDATGLDGRVRFTTVVARDALTDWQQAAWRTWMQVRNEYQLWWPIDDGVDITEKLVAYENR